VHSIAILVLAFVALGLLHFPSASAQNSNQYLYDLNSKPGGIDFKKWPILYWNQYLSQHNNKTTDVKDECYSIKFGSTIFLVNPFSIPKANYNCTFSESNSFFFPLYSEECDYESVTGGDAALEQCVIENNQYARGKVFIDGVELTGLKQYQFNTDFFNMNFTSDNPYDAKPGSYRALINGLFIFVKPLTEGTHELKYSMVQIKPTHDNDYASDITYKLDIVRDK
jgi:hypothetical protein